MTAASAFAVAACTLGPFYHRPSIPPPPAWTVDPSSTPTESAALAAAPARTPSSAAAPDAANGSGPAGDTPNPAVATWPSADWWHEFGSVQLDDYMAQARRANDDIAAAVARVRQADAQAQIAGAPLLPAIGANGTANRQRQKLSSSGATGTPVTFSDFTASATATYQVDFWGKNRATYKAARLAAAATRFDRATVELTVMSSVATSFFQAIELRDRLAVAQQNLATSEIILKDLRLEEQVGTAAALDVAQQETTVATLNASIPPLRQQLRQTMDALAVLMGRMPQELTPPDGRLDDLNEPAVGPGLPSELLTRRPDVAAAEAQLKSANANIAAARAAFFPSINLTADGGFVSTALAGLFTPANRIYALTAGITQPIFQGGALLGNYRLAQGRYAELLADYHKSVISAFSNVEDALTAAQQTAEQYRREQDAVVKARRAYEITEIELHAGTVNVLTVLNTQTALFNAQDTLVQVRFAHLQALVQLFNALGGGWQQETARS